MAVICFSNTHKFDLFSAETCDLLCESKTCFAIISIISCDITWCKCSSWLSQDRMTSESKPHRTSQLLVNHTKIEIIDVFHYLFHRLGQIASYLQIWNNSFLTRITSYFYKEKTKPYLSFLKFVNALRTVGKNEASIHGQDSIIPFVLWFHT